MGNVKLGSLKEVNLREIWENEPRNFTRWLAEPANIKELCDTIGIDNVVDIRVEQNVGKYSADIVCKSEYDGKTIVIENQLEETDHKHLGQIITYASGLNASTIIWVVRKAEDEHASAIEWLNEHIDEDISFFLVEIKVFKIGDSVPAPQFKIIEQPNDWEKMARNVSSKAKDASENELNRKEFWENLNKVLEKRGTDFGIRKANTENWYAFHIGDSRCHLEANLNNQQGQIRFKLWIPDCKPLYDSLYEHKQEIEETVGYELEWNRLDNQKASRISTYIKGLDFNNKENYDDLANKIIDTAILFRKAFTKYI